MNSTLIRSIEGFVFVLLSTFLTQLTVAGQPIDLGNPDTRASVLASFVSAFLVAIRQYTATRNVPPAG